MNIQARKNGDSFMLVQHSVNTTEGLSMGDTKLVYLNGSTDYVDFAVYSASSAPSQLIQKGTGDGSGTWFSASLQMTGSMTGATGSAGAAGPTGTLGMNPIVSSITVSSFTSTNSLTVYGTTDQFFNTMRFTSINDGTSLAIGYSNQTSGTAPVSSIAIGLYSGQTNQGTRAVSMGVNAGRSAQSGNTIAIGTNAAATSQGGQGIALGNAAGSNTQGLNSIAIGNSAGTSSQGAGAVAIGPFTAGTSQGASAIAIGSNAGATSQGINAVAIGTNAGAVSQTGSAIAIGNAAGSNTQATQCIAIGLQAQTTGAATNAIGIGLLAGQTRQSTNAVAIGTQAGQNNQGTYAIALGFQAGQTAQHASSIIINASGSALNSVQGNSLYINPIRNQTDTTQLGASMYYNPASREVTYSSDTTVSSITVNGTTSVRQIQEVVSTYVAPTGTVTFNWSNGAIFFVSAMTTSFVANISNLPTVANRSYVTTFMLEQGATAYYTSSIQINGTSNTINWANASAPAPTANRKEVESFTHFYTGTRWITMGQLASFG
jgi:hypothetical protein